MLALACGGVLRGAAVAATAAPKVPILVYHRFSTQVRDTMTVRISTFEAHLALLQRMACHVIPLSAWVAWRLAWDAGDPVPLQPRTVVLTADDGHRSQFDVMAPLLRERGWPMTLFVYPSAISNADYAMTWTQLQQLADEPLFSVQSHTYWHPNLLRDQANMPPAAFRRFAADQLARSRDTLALRLGRPVTLLAWPFGLSDAGLQRQAREAGYLAACSLGNRAATPGDALFALPRQLIVDSVDAGRLAPRLDAAFDDGAAA
jgi:peptidoglycan/xylan/chitin deacetylase (PgdA/CDA1 family)